MNSLALAKIFTKSEIWDGDATGNTALIQKHRRSPHTEQKNIYLRHRGEVEIL
jgi:hypothetical protein